MQIYGGVYVWQCFGFDQYPCVWQGCVWQGCVAVLWVRSETEVLSPVFFRIRFLDLVVRDVKIISKQHVGIVDRPER